MGRGIDTSMGQGGRQFPSTVWDCVRSLQEPGSADTQEAIGRFVNWYWRPVYRFIRIGWNKSNEDAKDLTQAFFLTLLERESLAKADPARGKFRTFLSATLRNFLADEHRATTTLKRGGAVSIIPHDFQEELPGHPARASGTPEEAFDGEWARTLISTAIDHLKDELKGKELAANVFAAYDLREAGAASPTYADLAARFGCSEMKIKRTLRENRDRLKELLVNEIRAYARTEEEVWEELEYLLSLWG